MWCCTSLIAVTASKKVSVKSPTMAPEEERTPTEYPSTGGLQILLQQNFLRESFRSFVKQTWTPTVSSDTMTNFKNNAQTIALNCIDFLTDVRDYNLMTTNSLFQSYRANHIFEKYIMHGAIIQV